MYLIIFFKSSFNVNFSKKLTLTHVKFVHCVRVSAFWPGMDKEISSRIATSTKRIEMRNRNMNS